MSTAEKEIGWLMVWFRCMEAEERSMFLSSMKRRKLGTADVENHCKQQSSLKRNLKLRRSKLLAIDSEMKGNLFDEKLEEKKARLEKTFLKKEMEKVMGKNSTNLRRRVKWLKEQTDIARQPIRLKLEERMNYLSDKFEEDKANTLPEVIKKYADLDVFKNKETTEGCQCGSDWGMGCPAQ